MRISRKIFGITYLIAIIAIAGICVFTISTTTETLRDLTRQRLYEGVGREARALYNTLDMVKSDLKVLADEGANVSMLLTESDLARRTLSEGFTALMQARPSYVRIVLELNAHSEAVSVKQAENRVRGKGSEVVTDADLAIMLKEARNLWAGNVHFSKIIERDGATHAGKIKLIYAATPIAAKDGRIEGALAIAIDVDALFAWFGRQSDDISFFLGDNDGNYLYRPSLRSHGHEFSSPSLNIIDEFNLKEKWQKWTLGSDPQLRIDDPERHLSVALYRVLLSAPVLDHSADILVVGGAASLADVEAQVISYRSQLAITALTVGGLAALALAWATAYLTRPIQTLTWVADRITAGDHDVSAPTSKYNDEFGVLAQAMMRMLDALRESAKIKEQAAMGRMATMIAHDVRNALSSVKMNLKILHGHHCRNRDEYITGCEIALDQVAYMENVLTDLLDFARPDNLELDWVDLDKTIEVALTSMLPAIADQSIIVCTDSSRKLPKLLGDRTRLIQVFQNLLGNAIQAMPTGGHLTIGAESQLHQSRPAVEIIIADTGCGIPEGIRDKIFEPFFTTRAKGTGLGLAIVQRLVQAHGGEVRIETNPEGGSIARVTLPLVPVDWQPACTQLGNFQSDTDVGTR